MTKEQVGLYVDGHDGVVYDDLRIAEAYSRERTSICTVLINCARRALFSVFYYKRRAKLL